MTNQSPHQAFVISREACPLDLIDALEERLADLDALTLAGAIGGTNEMAESYREDYFRALNHKVGETKDLLEAYDKMVRPQGEEQVAAADQAAELVEAFSRLEEPKQKLVRDLLRRLSTEES